MEPSVAVTELVQSFSRAFPTGILLDSHRIGWGKILDESPPSDTKLGSGNCSMKILGTEEVMVHPLQQAVYHIAGPV